jgi:hypothetical protein
MKIRYLFAAPQGGILLRSGDLSRPFLIAPSQAHPFLTLRHYFDGIACFVLRDGGKPLLRSLEKSLDGSLNPEAVQEIRICSEKHGALYHLASVTCLLEDRSMTFSVSTAVTEKAKAWLKREFQILTSLTHSFGSSFLPKVYFMGEVPICASGKTDSFVMMMAEWLENYHEWHLSMNGEEQGVQVWDNMRGNRYLSRGETFQLFLHASKILTIFYDTKSFSQIYPWHHAAGDFVVKTGHGGLEVKLTTVRNYEPFMVFATDGDLNPVAAILYFFLNLILRMRLDKAKGVGEVIWAEECCVSAAVRGFFEALMIMETEGRYQLGRARDLLDLLKHFTTEELLRLYQPLTELYRKEDPGDFQVVLERLEDHADALRGSIENSHL